MTSTLEGLVTSIFGYVPHGQDTFLTHIKIQHLVESHSMTSSHLNLTARLYLYKLYILSYNPSSKYDIFYCLTTLSQSSHKVVSTLHRMPQL